MRCMGEPGCLEAMDVMPYLVAQREVMKESVVGGGAVHDGRVDASANGNSARLQAAIAHVSVEHGCLVDHPLFRIEIALGSHCLETGVKLRSETVGPNFCPYWVGHLANC